VSLWTLILVTPQTENTKRKKLMFDKSDQWIHLETFDEFDNGLSELIDLWSGTATRADK
jgi:hypothetical protein